MSCRDAGGRTASLFVALQSTRNSSPGGAGVSLFVSIQPAWTAPLPQSLQPTFVRPHRRRSNAAYDTVKDGRETATCRGNRMLTAVWSIFGFATGNDLELLWPWPSHRHIWRVIYVGAACLTYSISFISSVAISVKAARCGRGVKLQFYPSNQVIGQVAIRQIMCRINKEMWIVFSSEPWHFESPPPGASKVCNKILFGSLRRWFRAVVRGKSYNAIIIMTLNLFVCSLEKIAKLSFSANCLNECLNAIPEDVFSFSS